MLHPKLRAHYLKPKTIGRPKVAKAHRERVKKANHARKVERRRLQRLWAVKPADYKKRKGWVFKALGPGNLPAKTFWRSLHALRTRAADYMERTKVHNKKHRAQVLSGVYIPELEIMEKRWSYGFPTASGLIYQDINLNLH